MLDFIESQSINRLDVKKVTGDDQLANHHLLDASDTKRTLNKVDQGAFRKALSRFPTGVTIVTGYSPENQMPIGLTVSSFNSVSLCPALVVWSLSNKSQHVMAFEKGNPHRIHVLAQSQEALATHFAQSGTDKFAGLQALSKSPATHPEHSFESIPCLTGCSARFDCTTENVYSAGDHYMILARVLFFEASDSAPLVFARGRFCGLSSF